MLRGRLATEWQTRRVETLFLIIAFIFGALFIVLVPPTQSADETTHFYRAYQLSEGKILSKSLENGYGDYMPREVQTVTKQLYGDIPSHYERTFNYRLIPHFLKQKMNKEDQTFVHLEGAAVYSPAGYGPQIIGIEIMKAVWPSVEAMYYAGRCLNLLLWIGLVYLALRIWPSNKWALFVLALLPMSLSQAASFSPDATINGLAFLTISGALYWAKQKKYLTFRHLSIAFIVLTILSLSKPLFFLLGFLGLLLDKKMFGSAKRKYLLVAALVVWCLLITAIWNGLVRKYAAGIQYYYYPKIDIDDHRQLVYIILHPFHYFYALARTYLTSLGNTPLRTFIGRLGWWDIDMPMWFIASAYALLLVTITGSNEEGRFSRRQKIICGSIFASGFLAVNTLLYLTITHVGANYVEGVQGRYFIAITPLLIPVLSATLPIKGWPEKANWLVPLSVTGLLITSLFVVVNRFI